MTRLDLMQKMLNFAREHRIDLALARPIETLLGSASGDLDIVIEERNLKSVIHFLAHEDDLCMTSCYRRVDGVSVFLYGINDGFIHIDFITKLALKGVSYAGVRECILRAETIEGIPVLHPVDLALIVWMTHGIKHNGALKKSYIGVLKHAFTNFETAFSEKLLALFGPENTLDMMECLKLEDFATFSYREARSYFLSSDNMFGKIMARTAYMLSEIECRLLAPKAIVAFYGVDGSGKTTLIHEVKKLLGGSARFIRHCHFLPLLPDQAEPNSSTVLARPHAKENRNVLTSGIKIIYLAFRYWIGNIWPWRGSVLFLYDRYLPDMVVDPRRYRYGGSVASLMRMLWIAPTPIASILVDVTAETAQKRKKEVSFEETKRQAEMYRAVINHLPNPLIVRGDTPLAQNIQQVNRHIMAALSARVKST